MAQSLVMAGEILRAAHVMACSAPRSIHKKRRGSRWGASRPVAIETMRLGGIAHNFLGLIGSSRRGGPADYTRYILTNCLFYMGKAGETVKHRGPLGKNSQSRIASHRMCCRWLFVLHPAISAYPSARSYRKQGLAKLRPDDSPPRTCGTRAGRQLQHCRALAIAQARYLYQLPVGDFQRIVIGHGIVHIDLQAARAALP